MTDPTPLQPPWAERFWADTPTDTLRWLAETVHVFDTPRPALFLKTINDELDRRATNSTLSREEATRQARTAGQMVGRAFGRRAAAVAAQREVDS